MEGNVRKFKIERAAKWVMWYLPILALMVFTVGGAAHAETLRLRMQLDHNFSIEALSQLLFTLVWPPAAAALIALVLTAAWEPIKKIITEYCEENNSVMVWVWVIILTASYVALIYLA
jgi:hypothetical protein